MYNWYIFLIVVIILSEAKRKAVRERQKKMIAAGRVQRRLLAEGKSPAEICRAAARLGEHIGERVCFSSGKELYSKCTVGTVMEVKGCWAEIETKAGRELINLNCYDSFTLSPEKSRAKTLAAGA